MIICKSNIILTRCELDSKPNRHRHDAVMDDVQLGHVVELFTHHEEYLKVIQYVVIFYMKLLSSLDAYVTMYNALYIYIKERERKRKRESSIVPYSYSQPLLTLPKC